MADRDDRNADQEGCNREKREMRGMMIFSAVAIALILGLMGANMIWHVDAPTPTDMSSQSKAAPAK